MITLQFGTCWEKREFNHFKSTCSTGIEYKSAYTIERNKRLWISFLFRVYPSPLMYSKIIRICYRTWIRHCSNVSINNEVHGDVEITGELTLHCTM